MLPAVILSAQVTIDGLAAATSKLSTYQKNWDKVTASVEAAGVAVDKTAKKIDELRAKTSVPIVQEIKVDFDDQGFEDFAIKKRIAEDDVTATLHARVADQGFEEFGIKKMIAADDVTANLKIDVEGYTAAMGQLEALRAFASRPIIQKVIIEVETRGAATAVATETAASSAAAATGGGTSGGGGGSPGMMSSLLGAGGGAGLGSILWGSHGGGGGGRRMPGWLGYFAGLGATGAGVGSLGSFAGFGAEHILMTLLGIGGSAASGAAGGALIGGGALGKLAVGAGSDIAVGASTLADTKSLAKGLEKAEEAAFKYGSASKQAKMANAELNNEMAKLGNTAGVKAELGLAKSAKALDHLFDMKTGKARVKAVAIDEQAIGLGKVFVPKVGHAATMNLSIVNKELKPLFAWLEGPEGIGIWQKLESQFKHDLPSSVHAFSQAVEFVLKTIGFTSKYTGGLTEMLDKFFTKWNQPAFFAKWRTEIEHLVGDFHVWENFIKAIGKALFDLFSQDAGTGKAIIMDLTQMINKADEWERSTEGKQQMHNLFTVHKEEILALLKIVPPLVTIFRSVYMTVAPPLVSAVTEVLLVVAELLEKFEQTGPAARWLIGLTLIAAKLGLLKPLMAFFKGQIVEQITAAKATSTSNALLATSYDEVAVSAQAAAEAQSAAAVASEASTVTRGAQTAMMMPEASTAGQLSLLGTIPKNGGIAASSTEAAGAEAGTSMAGSLAGSLASALGPALAAYGVINILTSVFSNNKGHMQQAGFEAGGAIAGGIAGFLIGGPLGAMIGVGLGSLGGELLSKLFESDTKHPLAERIAAETKHYRMANKGLHTAVSGLNASEKQGDALRKKTKGATDAVKEAQDKLTNTVRKYGPVSMAAHKAELELAKARDHNKAAADKLRRSESLTEHQQKLAIIKSKEVIATDKGLIGSMQEKVLRAKEEYEEHEHSRPALEKLIAAEEKLGEIQGSLHSAFQTLTKLAPGQAKAWHEMDSAQFKYGKNLHSLLMTLPEFGSTARDSLGHANSAIQLNGKEWIDWRGTIHNSMFEAQGSVQNFSVNSIKGIQNVMGETNAALKSLGLSKVTFHTSKGGSGAEHKKQTGGMIVPGSGTGDRVPLTAMVEPGEVVHVLNSRASSDMKKLGQLETLNSQMPRFQSGGTMSAGAVNAAMAEAQKLQSEHIPYVWGGGHQGFTSSAGLDCSGAVSLDLHVAGLLEGAPLTSGAFMQWGAPGPGPITLHANPDHVWMEILGRPWGTSVDDSSHGLGFYGKPPAAYTSSFVTRHPSGMAGSVLGAGGASIKPEHLSGPQGKLLDLGQGAITTVNKAANHYLASKVPKGGTFGGGNADISLKNLGSERFAVAAREVKEAHANHKATLALFAALVDEGGPDSNVLEGEGAGVGAPIMDMAHEISGFLTGKPTWTGNGSAIELSHQSGLKFYEIDQIIQASGAGASSMGKDNYGARQGEAEAIMSRFGLQGGGTISKEHGKHKKEYDPVEAVVKQATAHKRATREKGQRTIARVKHHIEGIGIKGKQLEKLVGLTGEVEKYDEYAGNAESLTKTNEKTGAITEGVFRGGNAGSWLKEKLGALMSLRNQLIKAHDIVGEKQTHVHKLFREAKNRLRHVEKAIRDAEAMKLKFEKEIKDIELAHNKGVHQLEKEKTTLEQQLQHEEGLKQTASVHARIGVIRGEIKSKTDAISGANSGDTAKIKALHEKVHGVDKDNTTRHRAEAAINELLPTLETQDSALRETGFNIYTSGGSVNNLAFEGLQTVQGKGYPLKPMNHVPPLGSIGGDIFNTQLRMAQIEEELTPKIKEAEGGNEIAELEKGIALEWQKKYMASQGQMEVLRGFPGVGSVAAVPYAGGFAVGGMVAATVGENGAETLLMPHGSNIVSNAERRSVVAGATGHSSKGIKFEHVEFHEAEGRVKGRANGESFDEEIKSVTRKQARSAMSPTPGGKH